MLKFTMFVYGFTSCFLLILSMVALKDYLLKRKHIKGFEKILKNFQDNKIKFVYRINNVAEFSTSIFPEGDVQIMYFIDSKEITITKNKRVIYLGSECSKKLIFDINELLLTKFADDMANCIDFFGNKIDKKSLLRVDPSLLDKKSNKRILSLDGILDKINRVGLSKLDNDEKEYLKKYSEGHK